MRFFEDDHQKTSPLTPVSLASTFICAIVKSRYIGDGHPTFNRNHYNGYINPLLLG